MKRNKFNLSHYKVGTCPFGKLIPISCFEVLPGDTIQMATSIFLRLSPMVNPSFSTLRVRQWTFFTPYRILMDDFEKFRTGGPDGLDITHMPLYFAKQSTGVEAGSVSDYLGVPIGYKGGYSALPLRAYCRIWNEFFRDEDLGVLQIVGQDTSSIDRNQNPNGSVGGFETLPYAWEKDYFTTARPWPQKGAEINVPVNAPTGSNGITISADGTPHFSTTVYNDGDLINRIEILPRQIIDTSSGYTPTNDFTLQASRQHTGSGDDETSTYNDIKFKLTGLKASFDNPSQGIGNVNLNDLREAFALQRFEEARAMYGSRYTEYLRYLGIRSSDARLQRPEYLGGGSSTMQISEVLQTAADGNSPVGTLRGHGVGANRNKKFRRFIEEDGIVMTLMSIMPITLYSQGLPKMFTRKVKEDFWTKELEHIGQQEVMTRELYVDADEDTVFGYQNRYDEYRSVMSTVCGQMRPGSVDEDWTMSRIFNNEPVLNSSFIYGSPSLRNFAEQNYDPVYFMASHSVAARRLMSKNGNPIL